VVCLACRRVLGAASLLALGACSLVLNTDGVSGGAGKPSGADGGPGSPDGEPPAGDGGGAGETDAVQPDSFAFDAFSLDSGAADATSGDDAAPESSTSDASQGDTGSETGAIDAGPSVWSSLDIGAVQTAGGWCTAEGCTPAAAAGSYEVSGSGADISGTSDAFHYVYQALTGDAVLVARLASFASPPTDASEKAGVMMRGGLTAGAPDAFLLATPTASSGYGWQVRTVADTATAASVSSGPVTAACGSGSSPVWTKIVRSGGFFSGFCSADGLAWNPVGDAPIPMSATIQIGLAVTSHNNAASVLGTATFDGVSLAAAGGTTPYGGAALAIGATQGRWYRIEGENYDLGGNGIAYWDTTPGNAGGTYRNDDVDIEAACGNGCYDVFDIAPGEWERYTVTATAGTYNIQLGVSSSGTSHMHLNDENGTNLTGPLTVASTGALSVFQVQSPTVSFPLTAGLHTLQIVYDDGSMDLNWIQLSRQ
jgi:hypothetical protein